MFKKAKILLLFLEKAADRSFCWCVVLNIQLGLRLEILQKAAVVDMYWWSTELVEFQCLAF